MFVNNLENNAGKKTTLYLRFEKYHNLHFFKKKKILRLIVYQQDIYCPCSANEQV